MVHGDAVGLVAALDRVRLQDDGADGEDDHGVPQSLGTRETAPVGRSAVDLGLAGRTALVAGADDPERDAIVAELTTEGARVEVSALAEAPATAHPCLDVIVVVLGAGRSPALSADWDLAVVERAWQDLVATVDTYRAALPGMQERGWGRLVCVLSTGVKAVLGGDDAPTVVGLGMLGLHKVVGHEHGHAGVTANAVLRDARTAPHDVAAAVAWLSSALSGYCNGTTLAVDGARTPSVF